MPSYSTGKYESLRADFMPVTHILSHSFATRSLHLPIAFRVARKPVRLNDFACFFFILCAVHQQTVSREIRQNGQRRVRRRHRRSYPVRVSGMNEAKRNDTNVTAVWKRSRDEMKINFHSSPIHSNVIT